MMGVNAGKDLGCQEVCLKAGRRRA